MPPRGHPRLALSALAVAAVAVALGASLLIARSPGKKPRNVVLISFDTCRADHLGCYGYSPQLTPNVDALARDGVRFTSVITPFPMTLPAHCSMLTGSYPATHGVHSNSDRLGEANVTLAEVMRSAGYQTGAVVGGFPMSSSFGVGQGFETYDDQFPPRQHVDDVAERKAEEVSRRGMAWLESHGSQPFFLFLHYYDPHYPYDPPAPFPATYDGELAYTDVWVGKVIDKLRQLSLYDNTLVVLVGDHGEGLSEHGEREHGFLIYQNTLGVPMIVRAPGGPSNARVDENVSLIDVVPTVLGLVRLSPAKQVDGADLSGYLNGARREKSSRPLFSESRWPEYFGCCSLFCVIDGPWKYIRAPRAELYDLRRDPGEQNNLIDKQPQLARRLCDRVDRWRRAMAAAAKPRTTARAALPKGVIEQLDSLGYVGGEDSSSGNAQSGADLKLEDPKDFLAVFERYQAGTELVKRGRYQEARKEFEQMVLERPKSVLGHLSLGEVAMYLHEAEAVREVSTALKLLTQSKAAPNSWTALIRRKLTVRCHLRLGRAFQMDGKLDEAIREYQTAFQMFPEAVDLPEFSDLVNLLGARGRFAEAIAQCRRAPGDPMLQNKLAWMLATSPDALVRDGAEALAIARQLVQSRTPPVPLFVMTMAAAYAETGQFRQAAATAENAMALAKSAGRTVLAREVQSQLAQYRAGRPYRETPPSPPLPGGPVFEP